MKQGYICSRGAIIAHARLLWYPSRRVGMDAHTCSIARYSLDRMFVTRVMQRRFASVLTSPENDR